LVECQACLDRQRRRREAGASDTASFDEAGHCLEQDDAPKELGLQGNLSLLLNEIYTVNQVQLPPGVDHADPATNEVI